jgi:hypothetical protein
MGALQLPDELQRLIDDARLEDEQIHGAAQAGIADMAAGRYTTVPVPKILNAFRSA